MVPIAKPSLGLTVCAVLVAESPAESMVVRMIQATTPALCGEYTRAMRASSGPLVTVSNAQLPSSGQPRVCFFAETNFGPILILEGDGSAAADFCMENGGVP
jgi:hypothetical protein